VLNLIFYYSLEIISGLRAKTPHVWAAVLSIKEVACSEFKNSRNSRKTSCLPSSLEIFFFFQVAKGCFTAASPYTGVVTGGETCNLYSWVKHQTILTVILPVAPLHGVEHYYLATYFPHCTDYFPLFPFVETAQRRV
jgi:hypothetical protein